MTLTAATIVGLVALAALVWLYFRMRSQDLIEEIMAKRRASARLVCRADFVEGLDRIPVALSLMTDMIRYENPDLDASLELRHIEEIEYDEETATGQAVDGKELRLRSHGHMFEFVLDPNVVQQWQTTLPPRHFDQGTAKAV
ncbi:MAG: hypothetical protein DMF58_12200 [Acidobacteria bacterium]|nr:MAG: hypothetical protein DMF58_12200 [Acidobacteriota bacterium]